MQYTTPLMNTLSLTFDLRIRPQQIYDFRRAIIALAGTGNDLFHNREVLPDGSEGHPLQRYPKIQYRIQDGYASLWAMNEGVDALKALMKPKEGFDQFEMFGIHTPLRIIQKTEDRNFSCEVNEFQIYRLRHFLPFNTEKYQEYQASELFKDKITLLEQGILNELVLFSYAAGWTLPEKPRLKVQLKDILHLSTGRYKTADDHGRMVFKYSKAFDLLLQINAWLPEDISLGRHKAYGYGVLSAPG